MLLRALQVGIILVGQASLLSGEGSAVQKVTQEQILSGMLLIVMSQAVQAAQITFEDYFMSEMSIAPMKIVGYEGLIGTVIMLFVMAPIVRIMPGALPCSRALCCSRTLSARLQQVEHVFSGQGFKAWFWFATRILQVAVRGCRLFCFDGLVSYSCLSKRSSDIPPCQ